MKYSREKYELNKRGEVMIGYILKQKWLIFLEVIVATGPAIFSVLFSFAMGDMTNAAVDGEVSSLLWASIVCVTCLAILYGLQTLEMYYATKTEKCNIYRGRYLFLSCDSRIWREECA